MLRTSFVRLALAAAFLYSSRAEARELSLDRAQILSRVSTHDPEIAAAHAGEAVVGAQAPGLGLRDAPALSLSLGRRALGSARSWDSEVSLTQGFDFERAAEVGVVDGEVAQARAATRQTIAEARHAAALAWVDALAADAALGLARDEERLAEELLAASEKRLARGDVLPLEVDLARAGVARNRAGVLAAEADRQEALGRLAVHVGLPEGDTLVVRGELPTQVTPGLDALRGSGRQRPEMAAVAARAATARALHARDRARRWPGFALGVSFIQEEDADIVLGTFSVELPFLAGSRSTFRGKGPEPQSRDALAIDNQVRTAHAVVARRRAALVELEAITPVLVGSEQQLTRRYDAGQMTLSEVLLVRRELLETRKDHLLRRIELARACIELEHAAGVL